MSELIGQETVACESVGTDKYGRMLGLCFLDGEDIFVANGLDYKPYMKMLGERASVARVLADRKAATTKA